MLTPVTFSLNTNNNKPIYDFNDILSNEPEKLEEWLNRTDIIIADFKKVQNQNVNEEVDILTDLLSTIDKLEEELKRD
jgi:hypothetical protein